MLLCGCPSVLFTLSGMNIMLLGSTGAGKSASGNTILKRDRKRFEEDFSPEAMTRTCDSAQTVVNGQTITVIDTVGLSDTSVKITDAQTQIENILQAIDLDVFLLVIKLGQTFTENDCKVVKWIQENFGAKVFKHSIVLFTHGDQLHEPIEYYLSKSETLRSVVDQCSGGFHVFNNKNKDPSQVIELLYQINSLRVVNKNSRYNKQDYEKTQKEILFLKCGAGAAGYLRIVLVGKTGSGKSSTGNTIMGRENSEKYFKKAVSPESVTKTCEKQELEIDEIKSVISVIDTPGLFDTTMSEQKMKAEIEKCVYMSVPGPHVFLLVIKVGRFTEDEKNAVEWIQKNFGEEAARYTIILFTHADALEGKPLAEYIRESKDLQALVDGCGGRFHSFNNKDMEDRSQVKELLEKIKNTVMSNGGQHYTNEMYKEAQKKIKWEYYIKKLKEHGKPTLTVIGGAVVVGAALTAAVTAVEAAGGPKAVATKALEAAREPVALAAGGSAAIAAKAVGRTVAQMRLGPGHSY